MIPSVNLVDLILIAAIGLAVYAACRKGFIDASIELAVWLGSFFLALFLSEITIRILGTFQIKGFWVRPVFFMLLLIGFSRLIFILCDRLSGNVPEETHQHWLNKAFGIFPGLLSGVIYAAVISYILLTYPLGNFTQRARDSTTVELLTNPTAWPGKPMAAAAASVGYQLSRQLTVHTKGTESISLPFRTTIYRPRPDLQVRMLEMINTERRKAGLKPMVSDPKLYQVALKHSADMLGRGYFSHYTPEGKSPFDRMKADNVRFAVAGENLALAETLQSAHEGLMNSPVHKANILHTSFGRTGLGILDAGIHGIIITQNFRN